MAKVQAYNNDTGESQFIPEHWLDNGNKAFSQFTKEPRKGTAAPATKKVKEPRKGTAAPATKKVNVTEPARPESKEKKG